MKILETFRSESSKVGICLNVEPNQKHLFNSKVVVMLILLSIGTTLSCMHFFKIAETFKEYTISFYSASEIMVVTICAATVIWKTKPLLKYLDGLERTINGSELTLDFIT